MSSGRGIWRLFGHAAEDPKRGQNQGQARGHEKEAQDRFETPAILSQASPEERSSTSWVLGVSAGASSRSTSHVGEDLIDASYSGASERTAAC